MPSAVAGEQVAGSSAGMLSRNEACYFARVSTSVLDKAISEGILESWPLIAHGKKQTFVRSESVFLISVLHHVRLSGLEMSLRLKKQLMEGLADRMPDFSAGAVPAPAAWRWEIQISPVVVIRPDPDMIDAAERAGRYAAVRDRWVERNPEIFGGEPVIAGTRITVHGIARRLDDGDAIETLLGDYPYLPREAFEVAEAYAQANPRRGRPVKPWRDSAAA